jgi:cytochrome c oxidase assembly protein subunit 15
MFRAFSIAAALAAFALAILGSWIRINGAGMTCPDWPLCHGAVVPVLSGGVILEWSHRMVAAVEGILLIVAIATGWRARNEIAGVRSILAAIGAIFVLQVGLGAATVALSNSPWSVVLHWATAMLLLAALTALAIVATVRPAPHATVVHNATLPILVIAAATAFVTMCAGAYVSSSGAGLACSTLPACDGGSWSGNSPAESAQMAHRLFAGSFFIFATIAAYAVSLGSTPRVRLATLGAYALIVLQIMLGIANVAWQLPLGLREAHAANAAATFIVFIAAIVFAAIDGTARERVPARTMAGTPARVQ